MSGLRSINIIKGKNPATVNVQSDGCYNNAVYSFSPVLKVYTLLRKMKDINYLMSRTKQSSVRSAGKARAYSASMRADALPILTRPPILVLKKSGLNRDFWTWLMLGLKWSI